MNAILSEQFKKDYAKLPLDIQRRTDKAIHLLLQDYRHPSLKSHKMEGMEHIYEARVTQRYRLTYSISGATYYLRRVGPHTLVE